MTAASDALGRRVESSEFGPYRELAVGGRPAFVLEGLLTERERAEAYERYLALGYRFNHGDRADSRHVLHWACDFEGEALDGDPALRHIEDVTRRLLKRRGLPVASLERAYANLALYGDVQLAHDDGDVWTALYFANPIWGPDFAGEFFLYGDDPDVAIAVQPRPGRLVVFDGHTPHRAGVPSKLCPHPRITVAIKLRRHDRSGRKEEP